MSLFCRQVQEDTRNMASCAYWLSTAFRSFVNVYIVRPFYFQFIPTRATMIQLDCRACMRTSLSVTIVALSFLAACGNVQSEAFMVYMAAIKEQFRLQQVDG